MTEDREVPHHHAGPQHWMMSWQDNHMPAPRHRFFSREERARSVARSYQLSGATVYVHPPKR